MKKIYEGKTKDVYSLENGNVMMIVQVKTVFLTPVKTA